MYTCPCTIPIDKDFIKVPQKGVANPVLYILGEAPGAEEVKNGTPFIGPAGQVLRSALAIAKFTNVRVGNTCLCRPTCNNGNTNRAPTTDEISNCFTENTLKDIQTSKPKCILMLGKSAVYALTMTEKIKMADLIARKITTIYPVPSYVYYHPSYMMRVQATEPGVLLFDNFVNLLVKIKEQYS